MELSNSSIVSKEQQPLKLKNAERQQEEPVDGLLAGDSSVESAGNCACRETKAMA